MPSMILILTAGIMMDDDQWDKDETRALCRVHRALARKSTDGNRVWSSTSVQTFMTKPRAAVTVVQLAPQVENYAEISHDRQS